MAAASAAAEVTTDGQGPDPSASTAITGVPDLGVNAPEPGRDPAAYVGVA